MKKILLFAVILFTACSTSKPVATVRSNPEALSDYLGGLRILEQLRSTNETITNITTSVCPPVIYDLPLFYPTPSNITLLPSYRGILSDLTAHIIDTTRLTTCCFISQSDTTIKNKHQKF